MRFWRLLVFVLLALAVIWSVIWLIGYGLIRTQVSALITDEPTSLVDDLLAEELGESEGTGAMADGRGGSAIPGLRIADFGLGGFPFGYRVRLSGAALDHPDLGWSAGDDVTLTWQLFRPFTARVDFSGSHLVSLPLQPPMTLSLDRGEVRVGVQPLWSERTGRLSRISARGEAVLVRVNDHDVVDLGRVAADLDAPGQFAPARISADIFDLAPSDHPRVQGLYQQLLATFPRADATFNALGIGLDRPVDHLRLRATIDPVFPLLGTSYRHRFFVARGGNVLLEVLDGKQGQWQGRASGRLMFGPDGRVMVQVCPQLRAGVSYVPLPSMIVPPTFYIGDGRLDVSSDPIPAIALPDTVPPFTQAELCAIGRSYSFEGEQDG